MPCARRSLNLKAGETGSLGGAFQSGALSQRHPRRPFERLDSRIRTQERGGKGIERGAGDRVAGFAECAERRNLADRKVEIQLQIVDALLGDAVEDGLGFLGFQGAEGDKAERRSEDAETDQGKTRKMPPW